MKLLFPILAVAAGISARLADSKLHSPGFNVSSLDSGLGPLGGELNDVDFTCESSTASPLYHHVQWLIENLENEDEDNLCFSAMVGMASVCGETQKKWRKKNGWNGGAVFQLCRTDMSGASYNCKGGLPGPVECYGEKACGGYHPASIAHFLKYLRHFCWIYDSDDEETRLPRVGGIVEVNGGELRLFTMPG